MNKIGDVSDVEVNVKELVSSEHEEGVWGYRVRSARLRCSGDVVEVYRKHPENYSRPYIKIKLSEILLPPNSLYPKVSRLIDQADLAKVVVMVLDNYLLRQVSTKSTHDTAVATARTVIRFIEYCWLNNIYRLKDVGIASWDAFLKLYIKGGWFEVLSIRSRIEAIDLDSAVKKQVRRKASKRRFELSPKSLMAAIGTNLPINQIKVEINPISKEISVSRSNDDRVSVSVLTSVISHLNNLADLPPDIRVEAVIHANPYLYAQSSGAVLSVRTQNFEPKELAALMAEAYRWVDKYGEHIVTLNRKVFLESILEGDLEVDETRMFALLTAAETSILEEALGLRIVGVYRNGDSRAMGLLGLNKALLAACFLLLGVMNGRRKDEISSRSVGVYADAFRCVDEELCLYESFFYCEKTVKDYESFYINELSWRALNMAKQISDIAWDVVGINGGKAPEERARKVFCWPPRGASTAPFWYDYSTDAGIEVLAARATGSPRSAIPNAHMFRRAYAVVFHYRYENADLFALSQQLRHNDLGMTMHYVLDGPSRAIARSAHVLWGDAGRTRRARAQHAADLNKEIKAYGEIKLSDDVLEILKGDNPVAGGFVKLVERFYRKLYGRLKYDDTDLRIRSSEIQSILLSRGHSVTPMPHGNCNAGLPKPGAGCYQKGRLAKEKASPRTCGSCPYHSAKLVHVEAIREDVARLVLEVQQASPEAVSTIQLKRALDAGQALLQFYTKTMFAQLRDQGATS